MIIHTPCLYALGCDAELSCGLVDVNDRLATADRMGDERHAVRARWRADWVRYIAYEIVVEE